MKKKVNKKALVIAAAVLAGVAGLGLGAWAILTKGYVDTEQLSNAVETTFEELDDNSGDFTEA